MNSYSTNTFKLVLLLCGLMGAMPPAFALQGQCLQAPSRTTACPNLVYRSVQLSNQKPEVICFCKTDFRRLLNNKVSDAQKMFNNMEWRQILAETGYTSAQLKRIVSG